MGGNGPSYPPHTHIFAFTVPYRPYRTVPGFARRTDTLRVETPIRTIFGNPVAVSACMRVQPNPPVHCDEQAGDQVGDGEDEHEGQPGGGPGDPSVGRQAGVADVALDDNEVEDDDTTCRDCEGRRHGVEGG
jgi:hypothetical protein